ncbi:MAG: protein rep [Planctomycetota bacterium]|nr:protein rep [Planctomycetota bacterium]
MGPHRTSGVVAPSSVPVSVQGTPRRRPPPLPLLEKDLCNIPADLAESGLLPTDFLGWYLPILSRNRDFYHALRQAALHDEAVLIATCGFRFHVCSCGTCGNPAILRPATERACSLRICGFCSTKRWKNSFRTFRSIVEDLQQPKHLTLTIGNVAHLTTDVVDDLRNSFTKLRRRKIMWVVRGGFYSLEFTWSPATRWHPHLHVFFDGPDIAEDDLEVEWQDITGDSWVVKIRSAADGNEISAGGQAILLAVGTAVSYILKGSIPTTDPRALAEYLNTVKNRKLWATFGNLRGREREGGGILPGGARDWYDHPWRCRYCGENGHSPVGTFHLTRLPEILRVNNPLGRNSDKVSTAINTTIPTKPS